jgi:hypothetical protein
MSIYHFESKDLPDWCAGCGASEELVDGEYVMKACTCKKRDPEDPRFPGVVSFITRFSSIKAWGYPDSRRRKLIPFGFSGLTGIILAFGSHLAGLSDPQVLIAGVIVLFFFVPFCLMIRFGPLMTSKEFEKLYPGVKQPGTKDK